MQDNDLFDEAVEITCDIDPRYDPEAYYFLKDALNFTCKMHNKPEKGHGRHVSAQELLEGIRLFALHEYGPMALRVLNSWGIFTTEDFGEIVFNLIEIGQLAKTKEDKKSDFANSYDFHQAFVVPFLPKSKDPPLFLRNKQRLTQIGKRRKS